MRVIGAIDLAAGRAVHAAGGRRDRYEPIEAVAGTRFDAGDAVAVANAYAGLGVAELYVADLDAIAGRPAQDRLITAVVAAGTPAWVDAGVTAARQARRLARIGVAGVVVGLETLTSWQKLASICEAVGHGRVAFSLDLRGGRPVTATSLGTRPDEAPHLLAGRAAAAGAGRIIVIDLARVGSGAGVDLDLVRHVRDAVPDAELLVGGGVRGTADLRALADTGCDGALVATALLDGRIGAREIALLAGGPFRAARQ